MPGNPELLADAWRSQLTDAAAWLRECSDWLLSNDLDMQCPMEADPLDLADELISLAAQSCPHTRATPALPEERTAFDSSYNAGQSDFEYDPEGAWAAHENCGSHVHVAPIAPLQDEEAVKRAFREAYELGFLEGYEITPRWHLDEAEGRIEALRQMEGLSEAWSDYRAGASIPSPDGLREMQLVEIIQEFRRAYRDLLRDRGDELCSPEVLSRFRMVDADAYVAALRASPNGMEK
jgi:hypothetical protein